MGKFAQRFIPQESQHVNQLTTTQIWKGIEHKNEIGGKITIYPNRDVSQVQQKGFLGFEAYYSKLEVGMYGRRVKKCKDEDNNLEEEEIGLPWLEQSQISDGC